MHPNSMLGLDFCPKKLALRPLNLKSYTIPRSNMEEISLQERFPSYGTYLQPRSLQLLRLVLKLDHPELYAALWRATDGAHQVSRDVSLQAIVAGKANEAGDPLLFARLVQVRTGKGRIPPDPKLLEPRPAALNKRRAEVRDAIGWMCVSGSQSRTRKISLMTRKPV